MLPKGSRFNSEGGLTVDYVVDWLTRVFERIGAWAEAREDREKRRR